MATRTKAARSRTRPRKAPRIASIYDRIGGLVMAMGAAALDPDTADDDDAKHREALARIVAEVMGRARDSIMFVAGSGLADWQAVWRRKPTDPPTDPAERPLWLAARAWDTLDAIEAGTADTAALTRAWRNWRATIASEPLDVRLQAIRQLQADRKDFVRRPGPEPVKASRPPAIWL